MTGGAATTIHPDQLVTPAQLLAVFQVLDQGHQRLVLSETGAANAGSASITSAFAANLSQLNIPQNVIVSLIGYHEQSPLTVTGSVSIGGGAYALQTAAGLTSVFNFGALNIAPGGLLTTNLPANYNSLAAASGLFASNGLNLSVVNSLVNNGAIESGGSLSIATGGEIINQSVAQSQAAITAQVLNLNTSAGDILNRGTIEAAGAINISSQIGRNLSIDNVEGIIRSQLSSINVRDADYCATGDLSITGGDIVSQELNLHGGEGSVFMSAENVTGKVSVEGAKIWLNANELTVGSLKATDDPFLSSSLADFTIAGDIVTAGAPLTIVARRSILTGSAVPIVIDTSSDSGNGGDILMVAGVAFSPDPVLPDTPTVTLDGPSGLSNATIDLQDVVAIDARGATGGGDANGGNVTMVSFSGFIRTNGTGVDSTDSRGIRTGGNGTGNDGNVLIISGSSDNNGVDLDDFFIDTTGGSGDPGRIDIATTQALITNGPLQIAGPGGVIPGAVLSGAFSVDQTAVLPNTGIQVGNLITNGGSIKIIAGSDIFVSHTNPFLGVDSSKKIGAGSGGNVLLVAGAAQTGLVLDGDLYLASNGINTSGNISGDAGAVSVVAKGDVGSILFANLSIQANGAGTGAGGEVLVVAGTNMSLTSTAITLTGASTLGGSIVLNKTSAADAISTRGGESDGNGGNLTLLAHRSSLGGTLTGNILIGSDVRTGGNGTGTNGNVLTIAGKENPGTLSIVIGDIMSYFLGGGTPVLSETAIDTSGGSGGLGTITLSTSTPQLVGGPAVVLDSSSATYSSDSAKYAIVDPITFRAAGINFGSLITDGAAIKLFAGGAILGWTSLPNVSTISTSRISAEGPGGEVLVQSANFLGSIELDSTVLANALGNAPGGTILIANSNGSITLNGTVQSTGLSVGMERQITITTDGTAGNNIIINNANVIGTNSVLIDAGDEFHINGTGRTISSDQSVLIRSFDAAGTNFIEDSSTIIGRWSVSILTQGLLQLGNTPGSGGVGVTISSGEMDAASQNQLTVIDRNTVIQNGSVVIRSQGSSVSIGDNTVIDAYGGGGATPTKNILRVFAFENVEIGEHVALNARGGEVHIYADYTGTVPTGSLTIGANSHIVSIAKLTDAPGTFFTASGAELPNHVGGRIAVYAGVNVAGVVEDTVNNLVNQRSYENSVEVVGLVDFDRSSANLFLRGGARLLVQSSTAQALSVNPAAGNSYTLHGGVIVVDPPGNQITFNGVSLIAVAPELILPAATVPNAPAPATISESPRITISLPQDTRNNALSPIDLTPPERVQTTFQSTFCQPREISTVSSLRRCSGTADDIEHWLVSGGPCQPFYMKRGDGLYLIAASGTAVKRLSNEQSQVLLNDGRLIVLATSQEGCEISTPFGTLEVPSSSAAIVDHRHGSGLKVVSLAGNPIHIRYKKNGLPVDLPITPGTELSLSCSANESLETAEPTRQEIDVASLLSQDDTFNCSYQCGVITSKRELGTIREFIEKRWGIHAQLNKQLPQRKATSMRDCDGVEPASRTYERTIFTTSSNDDAEMMPLLVQLVSRGNKKDSGALQKWITPVAEIRYFDAADVLLNQKQQILLGAGEIIAYGLKTVTVRVIDAIVTVQQNAMALISQEGEITKVRSLYDRSANAVQVTIGSKLLTLSSGEELIILQKANHTLRAISDQVSRRKTERQDLADGHSVLRSEFSIVSLMHSSTLLRQIVNSTEQDSKSISEKLFHMAACLQLVTSKHGPYIAATVGQP